MSEIQITIQDVQAAAERIAPHAHKTPVFTSAGIDRLAGASVHFKCENFQRAGAFKFRGACNAVFMLSQAEAKLGVLTHSSGNHAQALSLAASLRGIPAHIVMPRNSLAVKVAAVKSYGGQVTLCEPTLAARENTAREVQQRTGASFIHPYNDARIIAGQATAAAELIEQSGPFDMIIAPVGGGGLLSGTAITANALCPAAEVWGAEPAGADDAFRSLEAGRLIPVESPQTIADGLRTSLGTLTFPIIDQYVRRIVTVEEDEIISAMRLVWERMKIIIEPSSAVAVAAVLQRRDELAGKRIGVILSGGNVDLEALPWASA